MRQVRDEKARIVLARPTGIAEHLGLHDDAPLARPAPRRVARLADRLLRLMAVDEAEIRSLAATTQANVTAQKAQMKAASDAAKAGAGKAPPPFPDYLRAVMSRFAEGWARHLG
jgi:hypothetical protein